MPFPTSPSHGQQYTTELGVVYQYDAGDNKWWVMSVTDYVDQNIDGGAPNSIYTPNQNIDGGGPDG